MSTTVDNRVVKMTFDNKSFEKGVDETLKTIDKLNKSLEFKDASKGFDNIEHSADSVDFRKLESNIQTLTDRFSGLGIIGMKIWSNIGDSIYSLITGPFRAIESAIGSVTNQIKTGGWNRALNLDKAKNMLINLGQGYDAVNKTSETTKIQLEDKTWKEVPNRYKAINEAVDGTAYSFDEAALASANFLAVNEELSNEDLKKVLRASQGLAATYSKDFSQIASKLQKIQAAGHLTQDVVSELRMQGIAIEPIMQKYLGIVGATSEEMSDLYKSGAITYDMVVDALYNKFNNSLDKANDTFEGATNNMRSAMSRIGAVFYEPMLEHLIKGANQVRLAMNGIKSGIVDSKLPDVINGVIGGFINGIDKIFFTVDENGKKINNFTRAIFGRLSSYLEGFGNIILTVKEVFVDFGKAFYDVFLKGSFAKARGNADSFRDATAKMLETVKSYKTEIINGFKGILYLLKPLIKILSTAIKLAFKIFAILAKGLIIIVGLIGNLITLIAESKIFRSIIEKINNGFDTFIGWIDKAKTFVVEFFKELKIGEKVTEVFWNIVDAVKEFNAKYKPLQTAIDTIKTGFVNVYEAIKTAFDKLMEFIGIKITIPTLAEIKDKFQELGDKIKWAFENPKEAADEFIQKLKDVKNYIATGFSDAIEGINDKFKTFKDWIKGFKDGFGDANKSLEDFAEGDELEKTEKKFSILNGISSILEGFKSALEGVWGVIKSVAGTIRDFFAMIFEAIGDKTGIKDFSSFIEFIVKIVKLLKEAGLASLAIQLGEFFGTLSDAMQKGMGGNSSVLKMLPDAMMKIAIAMGVLALVVIALGSIKPEAAKQATDVLTYLVVLAAIMAKVVKSIGSLSKNTESAVEVVDDTGKKFKIGGSFAKTIGKQFTATFGKASEMWAFSQKIKAFGLAILECAAAFWVLSKAFEGKDGKLDVGKLAAGVGVFILIIGAITVAMKMILGSLKKVQNESKDLKIVNDRGGEKKQGKVWNVLTSNNSSKQDTSTPAGAILAASALVLSISSAVLVMAGALALLGAIPKDVLAQGTVAMVAIIGVIIGVMAALLLITKALGKNKDGNVDNTALAKQFAAMAAFVVAISTAILLLIPAIITLGLLMKADEDMIWNGIKAVAILGIIVSLCGAIIGASANKEGSLKLLIGLAVTLYVLISQIRKLASDSNVDTGNLIAAVAGISVILLIATLMIKAAEKVENALNVAALMGSLAAAIAACGYAISEVAKNDYGKTWSSVGAIVVLIAAIGGVMLLLSKLAGPLGITIIEGLAVAFVGIGAAVFLLAAAMRILLPIIDQIYDNRDGVKKKLGAFADIIAATIVGFIASLLGSLAEESLNLINQLGRLLLNLLVGIVDWIAVNSGEIGTAIGNLLMALVVVITIALKTFIGNLISVILDALGIHSPSTVFIDIGKDIVQGLINGVISLFETLGEKVIELFGIILDYVEKPLEFLFNIGKDIVQGLINGVKGMFELFKGAVSSLFGFITGFFEDPKEALVSLGEDIINGLKKGVEIATAPLRTAINVVRDLFDGLWDLADGASTKIADTAYDIVHAKEEQAKQEAQLKAKQKEIYAGQRVSSIQYEVEEAQELVSWLQNYSSWMKQYGTKENMANNSQIIWYQKNGITYKSTVGEYKEKMNTFLNDISNAMTTMDMIANDMQKEGVGYANLDNIEWINKLGISGNRALRKEAIRDKLLAQLLGKNVMEGYWQGISGFTRYMDLDHLDMEDITNFLYNSRKEYKVESPSKVFKWFGEMIMAGFGIGIEDGAASVDDIFATALSNIENMAENAAITPVFDLSEIQNESENAAAAMLDMKTNIPQEVDLLNNTNANKIDTLDDSVNGLSDSLSTSTLEQIISTQNDIIQALSNKLNDMGVYLDGNTLVGGILNRIDQGLGFKVGQVGRGVIG